MNQYLPRNRNKIIETFTSRKHSSIKQSLIWNYLLDVWLQSRNIFYESMIAIVFSIIFLPEFWMELFFFGFTFSWDFFYLCFLLFILQKSVFPHVFLIQSTKMQFFLFFSNKKYISLIFLINLLVYIIIIVLFIRVSDS